MQATPRLRQDLVVTPAQDRDGVLYYDVGDPRTGGVLRLYDFEWWVAERLDGQRSWDEVVRFTQETLGYDTTREDLEAYVQHLSALGLFDTLPVQPMPLPARAVGRELPRAVPREAPAVSGEWAAVPEVHAERAPEKPPTPSERELAAAAEHAAGDRAEHAADRAEHAADRAEHAADRLSERPTDRLPDRLTDRISERATDRISDRATDREARSAAVIDQLPERIVERPATTGRSALPVASAGALSDDVMGAPLIAVAPPSAEASRPHELSRLTGQSGEGVDVDLGAPSGDQRPTQILSQLDGAEGDAAPVSRVTLPPAVVTPIHPAESMTTEEESSQWTPRPPPAELLPKASPAPATSLPVVDSGPAPVLPPTIETPTVPAPSGMTPSGQVERTPPPVKAADEDEPEQVEPNRTGRWIAVLLILLSLAVVLYLLVGLRGPKPVAVQIMRAQPRDLAPTLPARAVVRPGAPEVLRMEAGGLLASVVGEGAEVSAGMSLAVLQSQPKLQKEVTDLRERLLYYQRRRDLAREKGDEGAEREAQVKVNEKQDRLSNAEASLRKAQLLATRSGRVTRVMVQAGEMVTPGSEILEIADRYQAAEVQLLSRDAAALKVGQEVSLQGKGGLLTARVASLVVDGDSAKIRFELQDAASVKSGEELQLVKSRMVGVVAVPAAAVVDGNSVYVLSQGKATRRQVSVVGSADDKVYLSGLSEGEEVIVSTPSELREGQPARAR